MNEFQRQLGSLAFASFFLVSIIHPARSDGTSDKKRAGETASACDAYGDPLPPLAIARLGTVRWRETLRDGSGFAKVAFSPDGKLVLSIGDVGFSVREIDTGKPVAWSAVDRPTVAATFSPDGKSILVATNLLRDNRGGAATAKQKLQRLEVGTGRIVNESEIERNPRQSEPHAGTCGFSPDGKLFVAADMPKGLRVWDASSGKLLYEIDQTLSDWDPFAFSADGKTIVLKTRNGFVICELANGKELQRIDPGRLDDGLVWFGQALSHDGKTLAASTVKTMRVWDVKSGKVRHELQDVHGQAAFSSDGALIACAGIEAIDLLDANTLRPIRSLHGSRDRVLCMAFSPDGKRMVTGNEHSIAVWDTATGRRINTVPSHYGVVYSVAFSADGSLLASGADDATAIVWNVRDAKALHEFPGHYIAAGSLTFSADGKLLATGDGQAYFGKDGREAQIRIFDLGTGRLQRQFAAHLNGVVSLAFSPDRRQLASAGYDARARVWDPNTGKRLYQIKGGEGRRVVAFSPDGNTLLVNNSDGELSLWKAETGEKLQELMTPNAGTFAASTVYLKDGKRLVSLEYQRNAQQGRNTGPDVVARDPKSYQEIGRVSLPNAWTIYSSPIVAISPDASVVALASEGRSTPAVQVFDASSGSLFAILQGHVPLISSITSIAFSPDGKILATASRDTTVLLWDVPTVKIIGAWILLTGDESEGERAAKILQANPTEAVPLLREQLRKAAALAARYTAPIKALDDDDYATRENASRQLHEAGSDAEFAAGMALKGTPPIEAKRRLEEMMDTLRGMREKKVNQLLGELEGDRAAEVEAMLQQMGRMAAPALEDFLTKTAPNPGRRPGRPDPRNLGRARGYAERMLQQIKQPSNVSIPLTPTAALSALAILERIGTPAARQALEETVTQAMDNELGRQAKAALDRLGRNEK